MYQKVIMLYNFTPSVIAENILQSSTESPNASTGNFCGYTSITVSVKLHMCQHAYRSTVSSYKRQQHQLNKLQIIQPSEFNRLHQVLPAKAAALPANQPILTRPNPHLAFLLFRMKGS
jgi:hypothetical protein